MLAQSKLDWFIEAEGIFFGVQLALALWTMTLVFANFFGLITAAAVVPRRLQRALSRSVELTPQQIENILGRNDSDLALALRAGLQALKTGADNDTVRDQALNVCEHSVVLMERRLGQLALFAQVNMLVGLLGTVWGLTSSFSVIGATEVVPKPSELAGGVSQALVTTIVGLLLAIPTLSVYAWLKGRAQLLLMLLEQTTQGVLARCRSTELASPTKAPPVHFPERRS